MPAPYARRDTIQSLARAVNRTMPGQAQGRFRGLRATSSGVAGSTHTDPSIADALDFSFIQGWSVVDDTDDTFTLDYLPVEDSWNLELNGIRVHRGEFSVAGQTVTITDPTALFLGCAADVAATGEDWDLEIQYDAKVKSADASIVGNVIYAGGFNASFELPSDILPGDLMVINSRTGGATGIFLEPGWFNIYSDAEPQAHYRVHAKFIDTELPGDFVALSGGSDFICAHVMTIVRGIDTGSPVVDFAAPDTSFTDTASVTTDGVNVVLFQVTSTDAGPVSADRGVMMEQGSASSSGHTGYYWSSAESTSGTVTAVVSPLALNVFMGIVALRPA